MNIKSTLFICILIFSPHQATAQALHWLSQAESHLGLVQNAPHMSVKTSANGSYLTIISSASNLVFGDNNQQRDVFIYNTINGDIEIVNLNNNGEQINGTSIFASSAPTSNGQWVAFTGRGNFGFGTPSDASDHVLYLKNLQSGQLQPVSIDDNGHLFDVRDFHLADDGLSLLFTTDTSLNPLHVNSVVNLYRKNLTDNTFTLLTVSEDGLSAADSDINDFSVSPSGRYIAIKTRADNLTPLTTPSAHIFLLDTNTGDYQLVTVKPDGSPSSFSSLIFRPNLAVSNNGFVAFISDHDDLVAGDNNNRSDLFLFNGNHNTRVNLDENGNELNDPGVTGVQLSADASSVVFTDRAQLLSTDNNIYLDIYAYEVNTSSMHLLTQLVDDGSLNYFSWVSSEAMTVDGNHLFIIADIDLVGVGSQLHSSLFVYDFTSQQTSSVNPVAFAPNTITNSVVVPLSSSDQLSVVYASRSPNLTAIAESDTINDLYLLDRSADQHLKIAANIQVSNFINGNFAISPSGRFIVFESFYFQPGGSINLGAGHVFLYDRNDNSYTQIAVGNRPSVNDAGMVVFDTPTSMAANDTNDRVDVYLFNPDDSSFSLISENTNGTAGNSSSNSAKISGSTTEVWISFESNANDLIGNDANNTPDVFLRSWPAGMTTRVSQTPTAVGANRFSFGVDISYEGDFISFLSLATNLTNDNYGTVIQARAFVYDRSTQLIKLVSLDGNGLASSSNTNVVNISESGRYISFDTTEQILNEDNDDAYDVYLYDQILDTTRLISKQSSGLQSDDFFLAADLVEDMLVSPALIGVTFTGQSDLTDVPSHPGYTEAFLYQQGGPNVNLNIQVNGLGIVSGSQGISCITDCDYSYILGTELSLIALPDAGYVFDRWQSSQGQCTDNTNPCNLTMNRDKQINAIFIDENDIVFSNDFE